MGVGGCVLVSYIFVSYVLGKTGVGERGLGYSTFRFVVICILILFDFL